MDSGHNKEGEFIELIDSYSRFIRLNLNRYNLSRYGLDPEDILQDVKIRIWKMIRSDKTIVSQASYIKKIVDSAVIDQLRKQQREENLYKHEKQKRISELEFSYSRNATQKKAIEETIGKAVDRLINSRRQVIKLYLLGFGIKEISSYFNWSQDKARNLLYRGLADLKRILKTTDAKNEHR